MEPAHGPTMPRIAKAYHTRIPPCPAAMEATCARICNRAQVPRRRNRAAPHGRNLEPPPPNPEPSEWAIGKFPGAHPTRTVARSAAFGMAARRARRATTDIPASGPPAAAAAEAPRAGAAEAACVAVAAVVAVTAVVDVDRGENNMAKIKSIDSKNSLTRQIGRASCRERG